MLPGLETRTSNHRLHRWTIPMLGALLLAITTGAAHAEYNCMPGTPIPASNNAGTFLINTPGCYFLVGNRTKNTVGPMIQIGASHVFLDLRGHTLNHTQSGQTIILNSVAITDVHVVNGKLTGAAVGTGVNFTGCPNGVFNVSDLIITDLGGGVPLVGIAIAGTNTNPARAVIARNTIDFLDSGIHLDDVHAGRIEDNVLQYRLSPPLPFAAISLRGCRANDIKGNTATGSFAPGFSAGAGIRLDGNSDFNNVQHNTLSGWLDGIFVAFSNCNAIDWNVMNGNVNSSLQLTASTANNVYSYNRASGACTSSGAGIQDFGVNVNAGNNF